MHNDTPWDARTWQCLGGSSSGGWFNTKQCTFSEPCKCMRTSRNVIFLQKKVPFDVGGYTCIYIQVVSTVYMTAPGQSDMAPARQVTPACHLQVYIHSSATCAGPNYTNSYQLQLRQPSFSSNYNYTIKYSIIIRHINITNQNGYFTT